jgi:hypothetical protein
MIDPEATGDQQLPSGYTNERRCSHLAAIPLGVQIIIAQSPGQGHELTLFDHVS